MTARAVAERGILVSSSPLIRFTVRQVVQPRRRLARRSYALREQPTLFQFVVLSMLLHLLLIVLIGDSMRSGARRGEDLWGALDVTLRRMSPPPAAPRATPNQRTEAGSVETSISARPAPEPAAPSFEAVPPTDLNAPQEADQPIPPLVTPPLLERVAPRPLERELVPRVELKPREAPVSPAPLERVAPRAIERELVPRVELKPREAPVSPAPLERIAPRPIERQLAPRVELKPREAPVPPAPLERIAPRPIERQLAPPVELIPRGVDVIPERIERISPRVIDRELAPPVELKPSEMPAAQPIERIVPERIDGELAPPIEISPRAAPIVPVPLERIAPARVDREMVVPTPATTRAAEPATIPAERAVPGTDRAAEPAPPQSRDAPGEPLPRLRFAPQPDEDMFKPRRDVVVPSAEPGGLPHIDRDAARSRAREIAREGSGSHALVQVDLPLPERAPKNPFDKAAKPDCRTAYAGLGLLAIPALLASALADTGCRW